MNLCIASTLLVLFSKHGLAREVCYDEVGCFSDEEPFRRSYLPASREIINVTYSLFVRHEPPYQVNPDFGIVNVSGPYFQTHDATTDTAWQRLVKPSQRTKIIVHDYVDTARNSWVSEVAEKLLWEEPCQVIAVDWKSPNGGIEQAAANGRLVASEIVLMLKNIDSFHPSFKSSSVHLIGHGLGAHVAGLVGQQYQHDDVDCQTDQSGSWWGWWREDREVTCGQIAEIGRISGLDPIGSWFETAHDDARLDRGDALYVDVIHTDVNGEDGINPGQGIREAIGHVDFYPNGGYQQPGCDVTNIQGNVGLMSCDHIRSISYYLTTIGPHSCSMTSYPCSSWFEFVDGGCRSCIEQESESGYSLSGMLSYIGISSNDEERSCLQLGFSSEQFWSEHKEAAKGEGVEPRNVKAFLRTDKTDAFCVDHVRIELELEEAWSEGALSFRFTDQENRRTELIKAGRVSNWGRTANPSYMLAIPRDFQTITEVTVLWEVADATSWFPAFGVTAKGRKRRRRRKRVPGSRKGSRKELRLPLTRLKVSQVSRQEVNFCTTRRRLRSRKETRHTICEN